MRRLVDGEKSYGSSDGPLRKYITLVEALDRVLGASGTSTPEGQTLHLSLVRTWAYYFLRAAKLRCAHLLYVTRSSQIPILIGEPDDRVRAEITRPLAQSQGAVFESSGNLLTFQVEMGSFRLAGALQRSEVWASEDIGFAADCLDLLKRVSERARRRELDKISRDVTDRQTMLKEVRPNSLYYNLLHALERVAGQNHSSLILRSVDDEALIAAEMIRFPTRRGSTRIGERIALPPATFQSVDRCIAIHPDDPDNESTARVCAELYGEDWGTRVHSALLVPLETAQPSQRLVAVLADTRVRFFSSADLSAIAYLARRTAPTISNSLHFSARLNDTSAALDEVILRSRSQSELLDRATVWLKQTFEASAVTISLSGDTQLAAKGQTRAAGEVISSSTALAEIPGTVLTRSNLSNRAVYSRLPSAAETIPPPPFVAVFSAPLHLLDGRVGALACHYARARQPSPFEHFLLEAAAQRIAAAVTIRALGDHQLDELRQALRLMEIVAGAADDGAVVRLLTSEVRTLFRADYCFVSVPDDAGHLHLQAKTWGGEFTVPSIAVTGGPADGITGFVASSKRIYRSGDVTRDPYYRDVVEAIGQITIRSEMAGPLVFEGRVLGVIDLMSSRRSAFSEQDETLLRMLLAHSSVALAHAQNARADRDHILLINQLHSRLLKLTTPDEIYAVSLDAAIDCVAALHPGHEIYGNLYVKRPGVRFLEVKAFVGHKSAKFSPTLYFNEGIVGTVANTGHCTIIDDTTSLPAGVTFAPFIEEMARGSEIAVPAGIGGEVDAVINLESPTLGLFGQKDLAALRALAHEISLAVRFAQLNESVLIDKRRRDRDREMRFLLNLSHEVAKSARITSALVPQLEKLLSDRPEALRVLALIRTPADAAIEFEGRLLKSLASPASEYESTDVISDLRIALQGVERTHPDVAIRVDVTPAAFEVAGNSDSLRFLFTNLFENAIAAMRGNGTLTVTEHSFQDPRSLVIDISDTGHGIPRDRHEKIWETFYSDDGAGRRKGFGVGLWLVREQMERMSGSVVLHRSVPGEGTTFRLTFSAR